MADVTAAEVLKKKETKKVILISGGLILAVGMCIAAYHFLSKNKEEASTSEKDEEKDEG